MNGAADSDLAEFYRAALDSLFDVGL